MSAPVLPGWRHVYSGKVRDLYEPDEAVLGGPHPLGDVVLVVASDRISAYDHVLATEIPGKGVVLTQLSLWWFEQLAGVVDNHVVTVEVSTDPTDGLVPAAVDGRAMVCRRLEMFPVECVVRGYLTGSGLVEYRTDRTVCGVPLPEGLVDGSRLPQAIFTPAAKAAVGEHDENVTFEEVAARIGDEPAGQLRDLTLEVYARASAMAEERGVILADTKLEFGVDPTTGLTVLGTRCSRRTRRVSGRRTSGSRAAHSRASTSSTCATGSCRPRRAGTARATSRRPRCPSTWSRRPATATSRRSGASRDAISSSSRPSERDGGRRA